MNDGFASQTALKFSSPARYLVRMAVFLVLIGFLAFILQKPIITAFMANPGLNGLIFGVLFIGILMALRQVQRLFREVRWARAEAALVDFEAAPEPLLLAPMASILSQQNGAAALSPALLRSILDSLAGRLDEGRDILRYLAGLLVFLGLLGTFWGLLETVSSIGRVISSIGATGEASGLFTELKTGLAAPLAGMGISFSSSLFGLAGSLVLGFLDLQAGQAQRRFYAEIEDWLATRTETGNAFGTAGGSDDIVAALNRLHVAMTDQARGSGSAQALNNLAEGVQGLVQHMRAEQQMIRDWVEAQAQREKELKRVLDQIARERAN